MKKFLTSCLLHTDMERLAERVGRLVVSWWLQRGMCKYCDPRGPALLPVVLCLQDCVGVVLAETVKPEVFIPHTSVPTEGQDADSSASPSSPGTAASPHLQSGKSHYRKCSVSDMKRGQ